MGAAHFRVRRLTRSNVRWRAADECVSEAMVWSAAAIAEPEGDQAG